LSLTFLSCFFLLKRDEKKISEKDKRKTREREMRETKKNEKNEKETKEMRKKRERDKLLNQFTIEYVTMHPECIVTSPSRV